MFGILGKIFGSKTAMNAGIYAIDALVFTDQEKSKLHLEFLKMYEPFRLAQRVIAFMLIGVFLAVYANAIVLWNIGVFTKALEIQGFYMEVSKELAMWNTETLGIPVAIIIGFYFGAGVVDSYKRTRE